MKEKKREHEKKEGERERDRENLLREHPRQGTPKCRVPEVKSRLAGEGDGERIGKELSDECSP